MSWTAGGSGTGRTGNPREGLTRGIVQQSWECGVGAVET